VRIDRVTYSEGTKETLVSHIVEEPKQGRVYPTTMGYPLVIAEIERRPVSVRFVRDCCR
jgi:hypothetical protein